MNRYAVRCRVQYMTVVVAESEAAAEAVASHTELSQWDDYPEVIEVAAVEEEGSYWEVDRFSADDACGTSIKKTMTEILDYLWDEEKLHFEQSGSDNGHIFTHLLMVRKWMEAQEMTDEEGSGRD